MTPGGEHPIGGAARWETARRDDRERALGAAHRRATEFLATLKDRPVWPRASLDVMRETFGGPLNEGAMDPAAVVEEIASRFTCLATARQAVLGRAGWDLAERGASEFPWVHVDGAFGLWAAACERGRHGEGTAAVTGAEWRGRAALRCSMSSWATTAADVNRTVEAIRGLIAA